MKEKIKVLHLIPRMDQGGAERQLLELLNLNIFHTVCELVPGGYYTKKLVKKNVELFDLGMKRKIPDMRALYRLNSIIKKVQPTIIHTWMYHASFLNALLNDR